MSVCVWALIVFLHNLLRISKTVKLICTRSANPPYQHLERPLKETRTPWVHSLPVVMLLSHSVLYLRLTPNLVLRCPLQASMCMCEEGFTEVLSPTGQLDQCAPIPILEIPTAGDKKGDVKTSRAINPTSPTTIQPGRTGRTWYLQPYGPGQTTSHDSTISPDARSFLLLTKCTNIKKRRNTSSRK